MNDLTYRVQRTTRHGNLCLLFSGLLLWLALCSTVRAQSVLDEFNEQMNGIVLSLAVQPDGKLLLGGDFSTINGTTRNGIAHLNTDGSLDASFDPGSEANDWVYSLAVQADAEGVVYQHQRHHPQGHCTPKRRWLARCQL